MVFKHTILASDDGTNPSIEVNVAQYILNDYQQFIVLAVDFDKVPQVFSATQGFQFDAMGKLEDQNLIFQSQVINSLEADQWDFAKAPNPEIVLITMLSNSPIVHYKNGKIT